MAEMEAKRDFSVPPPGLGQGLPKSIWANDGGVPLPLGVSQPSTGSPHSPNGVRAPGGGIPFPPPGIPPVRNTIMTPAAKPGAFDYRMCSDEEFKRHTVAMLMQREADMHYFFNHVQQMNHRLEALTGELMKTVGKVHEERRMREEIMNVMLAKEMHEKMERAKRDEEDDMIREELEYRKKEEWKIMQEAIAALERNQETLRELVERMNYGDQSMRSMEIPRALTPREIMENLKKDEEDKKENEEEKKKEDEVKKKKEDEKEKKKEDEKEKKKEDEDEKKKEEKEEKKEDKEEEKKERKVEEKKDENRGQEKEKIVMEGSPSNGSQSYAARAKNGGSPSNGAQAGRAKSDSTPSSGSQYWASRSKTPKSGGSNSSGSQSWAVREKPRSGVLTCFNCRKEGHFARDCNDNELECQMCGGIGHAAANCRSQRCFNCNKPGHRSYNCSEEGAKRCFHCKRFGHLAIHCKYAPKE